MASAGGEHKGRSAPIELATDEFRALGHRLVDDIADFLGSVRDRPVTPGETPERVREIVGSASLPPCGSPTDELLREATSLLFDHSLLPGHPRFWGYIVGAPAPIGALADLLAASVNPNVGGFTLSPIATEIELQTIRWIAELIGYPTSCGGLLVSGGNMANFIGFLAARRAKAPWNVRETGVGERPLRAYASAETHTWIQKAADLFGLGTGSLRWIPTDSELRLRTDALREAIAADRRAGDVPFLVVGAGGTVSTGAVDPLSEIAAICREEGLWFHVDGAYGAFAAAVPDAPPDLRAIGLADSIALDPHKWLYMPVEAGCALVRDPESLLDTFAYRPPYYNLGDDAVNFYELGPQNSRSFRALKVWLGLRQVGRDGYVRMLSDDIELARHLFRIVERTPELEAGTNGLSITTFRYVPPNGGDVEYLDRLNGEVLDRLERGGEAFVSQAVLDGRLFLRACIVNFRTTRADVEALPELVVRLGREVHAELGAGSPVQAEVN